MRVFLRAPLLFPQSFRFRWMVRLALGAGMVLMAGRPILFFFFLWLASYKKEGWFGGVLVFFMARW